MKDRLLVTGAAGRIGRLLSAALQDQYDLILTDKGDAAPSSELPYQQADIADFAAVEGIFNADPGIDTVIHLAADPRMDASWESLLPNNLIGVYNVFEAAHRAGCKRVVFASSINAVNGYAPDLQITTQMPVAPLNLYGASKAWGEAVGRFYADFKAMSVHCLRIGWVTPPDGEKLKTTATNKDLQMVVTHRDLVNLFESCLSSNVHFGIFHGISDNFWKRLDISDTRERTGYAPEDDGYVLAGKLEPDTF